MDALLRQYHNEMNEIKKIEKSIEDLECGRAINQAATHQVEKHGVE